MSELELCVRCGRPVEAYAGDYETFERMHYICFHYEFEHDGDPDLECSSGRCPSGGIEALSLLRRTEGVDIAPSADTVAPAVLALEKLGYVVRHESTVFVATAYNSRFVANDPVALLGLVKLVELRRPWRASDSEVEDVLIRFNLIGGLDGCQ